MYVYILYRSMCEPIYGFEESKQRLNIDKALVLPKNRIVVVKILTFLSGFFYYKIFFWVYIGVCPPVWLSDLFIFRRLFFPLKLGPCYSLWEPTTRQVLRRRLHMKSHIFLVHVQHGRPIQNSL